MGSLSRRELLRRGALAGAVAAVAPAAGWSPPAIGRPRERGRPRVAVVGAGLAGLACADRLARLGGVDVVLFEAREDRIGGRCWSSRGWASGQVGEHGGEFIDTRHARMRALAKRFGLRLDDLYAQPLPGSSRLFLRGAPREFEALRAPREQMAAALARTARRVGDYGWRNPSRGARRLDEMTVSDWLDEHLDGGSRSLLGRWVGCEMASEFGLDPGHLSAVNLLYEYVEAPATADERFHVAGGNDQIVHGLADALPPGTIRTGAPLERLARRGHGFALRAGGREAPFDRVVLALPFTLLREVDLSRAGLSPRKRRCIDQLGMGTNAKAILQASRRPPAYGGWNGYMLADRPRVLSWESSIAEPGPEGLITTYFGGRSGAEWLRGSAAHGPAGPRLAARVRRLYDRAGLAGMTAELRGGVWVDHWRADRWTRGSYAAFKPGQYTRFYGFAGRAERGIHFAGEHTATRFQGYLEGAVESGQRAAAEVHAALGRRRAA
jgi:monoamine oxidase